MWIEIYEENLPTEQAAAQAHARVPGAHGHEDWPQGTRQAACQGTLEADTLMHSEACPSEA
jgi:hypothetical protein